MISYLNLIVQNDHKGLDKLRKEYPDIIKAFEIRLEGCIEENKDHFLLGWYDQLDSNWQEILDFLDGNGFYYVDQEYSTISGLIYYQRNVYFDLEDAHDTLTILEAEAIAHEEV